MHLIALTKVITHPVFGDIISGSQNFKKFASTTVFGLIMLALGKHFITDNHRQAYSSSPLVLFILVLAGGAAGVASLRSFGVNLLDFVQGK
jgi:hypothetical protein